MHLSAEEAKSVGGKYLALQFPWLICWRKEIDLQREGRRFVNGGQLALAIVGQVLKRLPHEVLVQVLQQMVPSPS